MIQDSSEFLKPVAHHLRQQVAPQANHLDQDAKALCEAMIQLGEMQLLGLQVPQEWGGQGLDELTFRQFQELVSRYSGALAFLQTQHQSAAAMLATSTNTGLKQQYLADVTQGKVRVGVGLSHLRRQGPPAVEAIAVDEGFHLRGEVPWVTGFGCFQHFVIGALLPDGQTVFGWVPLTETHQPAGGRLTSVKRYHWPLWPQPTRLKCYFKGGPYLNHRYWPSSPPVGCKPKTNAMSCTTVFLPSAVPKRA